MTVTEPSALGQLIDRLTGWRRYLIAALMGVVAVAAFPPYGIIPALIPAFAVLLWLARSAESGRGAFAVGLAFGIGHFYAGLYWIAHAFAVYGGVSAIAGWPAVGGLSLYLAVYPGIAAWVFWRWGGRGSIGVRHALLFAAIWTLTEWARGWLFTGFPWNPVGSVWVVSDAMLQVTSLVGIYGLTFATVFAASIFAGEWWQGGTEKPRGWWRLPVAGVGVLLLVWGGGTARLAQAPVEADQDGVVLRLVQPNIPQKFKWARALRPKHVSDQIAMSILTPPDATVTPTHVLWAETAIPFVVNGDGPLLADLAFAAPPNGHLISGGLRRDGDHRFNSLFAIDANANITAHFDKVHLVPFGEYMPFGDYLPFDKLTPGRVDFSSGASFAPIDLPGLPAFQPLICYEAIFPGGVVAAGSTRPEWLLNITNDAWYGISTGPYQHFGLVRIRAVEEGLPVVRVANTGISGVVDSWGRVRGQLALGTGGILDSPLPSPLPPTIFARYGNVTVVLFSLIVVGWACRKRPINTPS